MTSIRIGNVTRERCARPTGDGWDPVGAPVSGWDTVGAPRPADLPLNSLIRDAMELQPS